MSGRYILGQPVTADGKFPCPVCGETATAVRTHELSPTVRADGSFVHEPGTFALTIYPCGDSTVLDPAKPWYVVEL